MSIAIGISATKAGFDLIKSVRELVKRPDIDAGEISARLLELQDLMLDARDALSEAQDEKARLEAKVTELMRMADFGKDFKSEHGVLWYDGFPYCPTCWNVDRKTVRLGGPGEVGARNLCPWTCPIHKVEYRMQWNIPQTMRVVKTQP
jgi:hypothetical protein